VSLRSGQPNYLFSAAQQTSDAPATFTPPAAAMPAATPVAAAAGALPAMGDPAQYSLAKLRLQEAHGLTKGNNVLVAVIDSGIDAGHPELRGVIAGTFDALNKSEKPHLHGTAMAGAIAARSRLMGVAPAARILAIRAFSAAGDSAQATTFAILKGIDHAVNNNARVINMSFAGPADPGVARALAAARAKGIVLVAAAGNLGEKSPPQYPAADPNVIAVTATDAEDKLFQASNRGGHIAVAAPGVDILVPAPGANYDMTSGTSVASAHVSGVVALILERKPGLDPDAVRKILLSTAKDLGPSGQDEQFGAGLADAYQAILAVEPRSAAGSETVAQPAQ
jgi:subtilisin family serine protease